MTTTKELVQKIDDAIGKMADQAKANSNSINALQYAQAALSLSHSRSIVGSANLETITTVAKDGKQSKKTVDVA